MTNQELLSIDLKFEEMGVIFKESLTEQLLTIYHRVLQDLSMDDVLHACELWLASDTHYFPKPGQLRTLALNLPTNPHAPDNLKTRAELAWQNLRGLARDRYNRWALGDLITRQVFRLMGGGYTTDGGFGQWEAQYEELKHREFLTAYLDLAQHQSDLPPLPMGEPALLPATESKTDYQRWDEDRRADVKALIAQIQDRLSIPPVAVPVQYLRERPEGNPLTYVPHLSPEELAVRTRMLHRQAQAVMAQEAVRKLYAPAYEPSVETSYVPPAEGEYLQEPQGE